jgi:hypothetical protein
MLICFVVPVVFKYSLYATGNSYLLWIEADASDQCTRSRRISFCFSYRALALDGLFSLSSELSICSCHSLSFVLLREFEDTLY